MIHLRIYVNRFLGLIMRQVKSMKDRKLTPDMVPVIKLARSLKYNYARIAAYFQINQGRIADVMMGRRFPDVPAAKELPADFPPA